MKKNLIHRIYQDKTIRRIEKKQKLLGLDKTNVYYFLNNRLIITLAIFFGIVFIPYCYALAILVACTFYYFYEYFYFDVRIKKRGIKLESQAIYFFENLVITLDNTPNLKKALEIVSNNIDNDLSFEFKRMINEINLGKSVSESLDNIQKRIPSTTINNIILSIASTEINNKGLKELIKTQITYISDKLFLRKKVMTARRNVCVILVSTIFVIIEIFLIIFAPLVLNMIK